MGGYGIVGGNLPIAAGLALASDYKGEDAVTVCMFGDGASNAGNFGETMNLAALWKLPVVFLVENNLYGMGTAVERHSAQTDLSKKAEGYGVPGERIDGMDVLAVREGVAEDIRLAREERRPTLVEAFTYRYRGHSAADPEVYREQRGGRGVAREGPDRDLRPALHRGRACSASARSQEVREQGRGRRSLAAVEFADASPEPPLDTLYENLYVLDATRAAGTRSTSAAPSRTAASARTRMPDAARELAEAGAAYAGQPRRRRGRNPATRRRRPGRGRSSREVAEPRTTRRTERLMADAADARGAARRDGARRCAATSAVFVMGEDVGVFQGAFKVTEGLLDEFGERRVRDTPISENTIVGMGVGAAMGGLRPVVELMTVNFSLLALRPDRQPRRRDPLHVQRPGAGADGDPDAGRRRPPARPDPLAQLRGAVPAGPGPAGRLPLDPGRRQGAAEGGDPRRQPGDLHRAREPLRDAAARCPRTATSVLRFGEAAVRREGADVTIVGILKMAHVAEDAAQTLAARARRRGRGDRPAHAAPARPRHDPRVGAQDQPGGDRRGGLAARRRRRQPRGADHRAGLRPPRRAGAAGHRRRRADALLEAARAGGDPARGARRQGGARRRLEGSI